MERICRQETYSSESRRTQTSVLHGKVEVDIFQRCFWIVSFVHIHAKVDKHGNQVRISTIKTQCYMQEVANGFRLGVFQRQVEHNKRPETNR